MKTGQGLEYLLLVVMLLTTCPAMAADSGIDFQLGLAAGQRSVDYDSTRIASGTIWSDQSGNLRPGFAGARVKFDFEESLNTAVLTGAALYKDFYVSFNVELAISPEDTGLAVKAEPVPGPGIPLSLDTETDFELDRSDFSFTMGHRVWRGLSVFGGYRYTEFELNSLGPNLLLEEVDSKYTEEGIFLGGSYGFRIADAGTLSFSVGYAFLDVDFSQSNISKTAPEFLFAFQEYTFSASATGLSYGVLWTGDLGGRWAYTLGLKYQEYSSKDDATSQEMLLGESFPPGDPGAPYTSTNVQHTKITSDHSDTTALVGLIYRF
jgi:hypothetical protein